jgi:hypothetical protein
MEKKGFFRKLFDKFDEKLKEKSDNKCCCNCEKEE